MLKRKSEHIYLTNNSQMKLVENDTRFYYEPIFEAHPQRTEKSFKFLGKKMKTPIWISSITGGTKMAMKINTNLAKACNEFGMGMGLGSCRSILYKKKYFNQFNLREIIGDEYPLYANLGISQIERILKEKSIDLILNMIEKLKADGLIIHVNPIQEWLQPEGDVISVPPLNTIQEFIQQTKLKVIIKEVGQGFGPKSLEELVKLPIEAIEFGAFGGTNFAKLELQRCTQLKRQILEPFSKIGNPAEQMVKDINSMINSGKDIQCKSLIISGGIKTFLDGYFFIKKSVLPSIYGHASTFLKHAKEDYKILREFIQYQAQGLLMAEKYLEVK